MGGGRRAGGVRVRGRAGRPGRASSGRWPCPLTGSPGRGMWCILSTPTWASIIWPLRSMQPHPVSDVSPDGPMGRKPDLRAPRRRQSRRRPHAPLVPTRGPICAGRSGPILHKGPMAAPGPRAPRRPQPPTVHLPAQSPRSTEGGKARPARAWADPRRSAQAWLCGRGPIRADSLAGAGGEGGAPTCT